MSSTRTGTRRSAPPTLAVEVLVLIFGLLHHKDLLRCSAVCKRFRNVINDVPALRYIIELSFDGLIQGDPSHPSTSSQRLQTLLDRRMRWRTLDWAKTESINPEHHAYVFDFSSPGTFARIAYERAENDVVSKVLLKIASFGDEPLCERTYAVDTGIDANGEVVRVDFLVSQPSSDLVVLVENGRLDGNFDDEDEHGFGGLELEPIPIRMHLRSLSSAGRDPHPMCHLPTIDYFPNCGGLEESTVVSVSLHCDLLSVTAYNSSGREVSIWNYKTGNVVAEIHQIRTPNLIYEAQGFSFISPTRFLVTSFSRIKPGIWTDSIDIFSLDPNASGIPWPPKSASPWLPSTDSGLRLIASLCLPQRLQTETNSYNYSMVMDITSGQFSSESPVDSGVPFTTAPGARVHYIRVSFASREPGPGPCFALMVHQDTIDAYIAKYDATDAPDERRLIPWEEWGPDNTRCLNSEHAADVGHQQEQFVQGERVVCLAPDEDGNSVMQLLDFNTRGRYRTTEAAAPGKSSACSTSRLVTEQSSVSIPAYYHDTIVSSLPYYAIPLPDVAPRETFALNERGLFRAKRGNPYLQSSNEMQICVV